MVEAIGAAKVTGNFDMIKIKCFENILEKEGK